MTKADGAVDGGQGGSFVFETFCVQAASMHPPAEGGKRRMSGGWGRLLDHVATSIPIAL